MSPALAALLTQLLALLVVMPIAVASGTFAQDGTSALFQWAVFQGIIAAAVGHRWGMAVWWLPIHLAFFPALVAGLSFDPPPLWFLGVFVLLALVYGKIYRTQVPLYHSSRAAARAVASLLPERRGFSFIDLGSGCGGLLRYLGTVRPDGNYEGIEAALLPFLVGKCRHAVAATGCRMRCGDFWGIDLAAYDVVHVYLSPAPMAALWRKALREMRPGSIFISNSFAVPGVAPGISLELDDLAGSALHVWRM